MEDLLKDLIEYAIDKKASDIHFVLHNQRLQIQLRTQNEMIDVYQDIWKPSFFEYLKFISQMDLTNLIRRKVDSLKYIFIIMISFVASASCIIIIFKQVSFGC